MGDIKKEDIGHIRGKWKKKFATSSLRFRQKFRYIFLAPVYMEVGDPR